jgi:hypothetical protein
MPLIAARFCRQVVCHNACTLFAANLWISLLKKNCGSFPLEFGAKYIITPKKWRLIRPILTIMVMFYFNLSFTFFQNERCSLVHHHCANRSRLGIHQTYALWSRQEDISRRDSTTGESSIISLCLGVIVSLKETPCTWNCWNFDLV